MNGGQCKLPQHRASLRSMVHDAAEFSIRRRSLPGFGQSFIRKENLAAYANWIVAGDYSKLFEPPIKPKTEPPMDAPKYDLPSLVDIEAETGDQSTKSVGDVIHVCTRAEAIEDGVLVDVTETAKEAGI